MLEPYTGKKLKSSLSHSVSSSQFLNQNRSELQPGCYREIRKREIRNAGHERGETERIKDGVSSLPAEECIFRRGVYGATTIALSTRLL